MSKVDELYARCKNVLPGHGPNQKMKDVFLELADGLDGTEALDRYGSGDYLSAFETEVAEMFGKPAAVFLPSGIMAQQTALRIWCERSNNFTVAMHPTAHLEFAEQFSYQFMHGLLRLQFGTPEILENRMLTLKDFQDLGKKPGVEGIDAEELLHHPLEAVAEVAVVARIVAELGEDLAKRYLRVSVHGSPFPSSVRLER